MFVFIVIEIWYCTSFLPLHERFFIHISPSDLYKIYIGHCFTRGLYTELSRQRIVYLLSVCLLPFINDNLVMLIDD